MAEHEETDCHTGRVTRHSSVVSIRLNGDRDGFRAQLRRHVEPSIGEFKELPEAASILWAEALSHDVDGIFEKHSRSTEVPRQAFHSLEPTVCHLHCCDRYIRYDAHDRSPSFLGRDCPERPHHDARSGQWIGGGSWNKWRGPASRGEAPFMPRKSAGEPLSASTS
jgi:hypothetical protein